MSFVDCLIPINIRVNPTKNRGVYMGQFIKGISLIAYTTLSISRSGAVAITDKNIK